MKYFTVEEATALIPKLAGVMSDLRRVLEELGTNQYAVSSLAGREGAHGQNGNGHNIRQEGRARALKAEREEIDARLKRIMDEVSSLGVEIKDVHSGLADFRSTKNGREIYLCWKVGEESIEYWHELDTGFAGRQLL